MEKVFYGYAEACQNGVLESRKQKDKVFHVFNKVISGVQYALTDDENSTGNWLQSYQNGIVYVKPKGVPVKDEPKIEMGEIQKLNISHSGDGTTMNALEEPEQKTEAVISEAVKQPLPEQFGSIEPPTLNVTEEKQPVNE